MTNRPIDELCELLEVESTYGFTKKFGVSNGTLSNINNSSKKNHPIVTFLLQLSLECLEELPREKRSKISHSMRKTLDKHLTG